MNKLDIKNDYYVDVTEEWLKKAKPNSHKVREQLYFDYQGSRYYVDGKNVVLDYSKEELEMAYFLKNTFGGEIYRLPKINKPNGIKTADYLWDNEYWDLKTITGSSNQTMFHAMYKQKRQCSNFILDISLSKLPFYAATDQVQKIFSRYDTIFINTIILKKNSNLKILKRCDRTGNSARPHLLNKL